MIFKSQAFTQASGSIGGMTYSHNAGGMYTRARSIPTNPNTPQQQAIRTLVAQLSNLWLSALTQAQRQAWNVYAANVTVPNALGDQIHISGLNQYVRSNVPRNQANLARVDDAPTVYNIGDYTDPSFTADAALNQASVDFTDTDEWVGEDDAAMLCYFSRPQNISVNYFKGPYRFADLIPGDAAMPPTSPATINLPFVITAGQRVFGRFNVVRADGRLAADFRSLTTAA